MTHKITMTLDRASIDTAIREIEGYRKELERKVNALMERLVNHGVDVAKMFVRQMDANYTGYLESSIEGYYNPQLHAGWIMAGTPYAIYVEYGTGVVGEGTHAGVGSIDAMGAMSYTYDVNGHGEAGWNYYDPLTDHWWHTMGMAARPFMGMTATVLDKTCEQIASEVFGR